MQQMPVFDLTRLTVDNNVMHAKPDLRVFLKWMIAGSGSVITDVIWLNKHVDAQFFDYRSSSRIEVGK